MDNAISQTPTPTPVPRGAHVIGKFVNPIYRLFDWLYSSGYNPLYRSGTLAVGFLFILLVTGLYLSFFYSVSDPYQSIVQLQNQVWLGRWIRTLHRYATVATLFALFFHIIQLLVQGKNWGPRTLAWLSGIVLTLMFCLSAWTGYVMVWDLHGQKVAITGARMLSVVPILKDVVLSAFDGATPIPAGFFFMNLFLHVALPVLMIMFLWIHTARLSRAVWFPIRSIMIWSSLGLIGISIVWSAPLLDEANLLSLVGRIPIDAATGFWIPWIDGFGITTTWIIITSILAFLAILPWWWRPSRADVREKSSVDTEACTGCTQCARDCPYEAIRMVPRPDGKRLIAEVVPSYCVSCGICAASCADFAIGPSGRTATDQRERVLEFCKALKQKSDTEIVFIFCTNNYKLSTMLAEQVNANEKFALYPVECCGCVHTEVIEQILQISKGLVLIGCPARNCFNRDGGDLLSQRIFEKRVPFLDRSIDRERILITAFSEAETDALARSLRIFERKMSKDSIPYEAPSEWPRRIRTLIASIFLLVFCASVAQFPIGTDVGHALIRVAGLLPSSAAEECHVPTAEEIKDIPLHMRPKEICRNTPLSYDLAITVDGNEIMHKTIKDVSYRVDRPILLDFEAEIEPGSHQIIVELRSTLATRTQCTAQAELKAGEIFLVHYLRGEATLKCGN